MALVVPKSKMSRNILTKEQKIDLVLACQSDARDKFGLHEAITCYVRKKEKTIYSPHEEIINNSKGNIAEYVIETAIPKARGIIVHLSPLTPDVREMLQKTYDSKKPFLILYSSIETQIPERILEEITTPRNSFCGEIRYENPQKAIDRLVELERLLCHEHLGD